jgi:hypothetical protein
MAYLAERFGASEVASAVRKRMGHRRARTTIGPTTGATRARDARLGVDDRVGVAGAE